MDAADSAREKNLALRLQNSNYCQGIRETEFYCFYDKERFELGGDYEYYPDRLKYLAVNVGVAAATFVGVFALVYLIPMLVRGFAFLIRRYWKWLSA